MQLEERLLSEVNGSSWVKASQPLLDSTTDNLRIGVSLNGKDFVTFDRRGVHALLYPDTAIVAIEPISGPRDGGTIVTFEGSGFELLAKMGARAVFKHLGTSAEVPGQQL